MNLSTHIAHSSSSVTDVHYLSLQLCIWILGLVWLEINNLKNNKKNQHIRPIFMILDWMNVLSHSVRVFSMSHIILAKQKCKFVIPFRRLWIFVSFSTRKCERNNNIPLYSECWIFKNLHYEDKKQIWQMLNAWNERCQHFFSSATHMQHM